MELFAADQDSDGPDVARRVLSFEVSIAPIVADSVDDARSPERDPDHLDGVDRDSRQAEQQQVDDRRQQQTGIAVPAVQVPLEPVIGRATAVTSSVSWLTASVR